MDKEQEQEAPTMSSEAVANFLEEQDNQKVAQAAQLEIMGQVLEKAGKLEAEYDFLKARLAGSYATAEELPTIQDRMTEIKVDASKLAFALQTGNLGGV